MYSETAEYYDLIYKSFKDYKSEAARFRDLIKRENPSVKTLLDVACGTGEHDKHFVEDFCVTGIDIDPTMIRIASQKVPSARFYEGNMSDFDLGEKFDAIVCLFCAIGYVKTKDQLQQTIRCFRNHLNVDGVMLIEPWYTPEQCPASTPHVTIVENENTKICRMWNIERQGFTSFVHRQYLIGTGEGVQHRKEIQELGLFEKEEILAAFNAAGLNARHVEEGLSHRGLYIARPC